jgi:mRNA-degrading endonuclease toxin of MazEF toxin-antitoxin module
MNRGDVVLVRFPHPSGARGKKRPAVVVQADAYLGVVSTLVVAQVTKNLTMAGDPACLFIDTSTPERL